MLLSDRRSGNVITVTNESTSKYCIALALIYSPHLNLQCISLFNYTDSHSLITTQT